MPAQDAFTKLDKDDVRGVLKDVAPALEGAAFDPATATVLAQDLPFYPGCRFLDLSDFSVMPAVQRFAVHGKGHAAILNGTAQPFYLLNATVPLKLNERTVVGYARFFLAHVRGRHGRFLVIDSADDIVWKDELPPAARKAIGQMIEPLQVKSREAGGSFTLMACVLFKDALFRTTVTVAPDGAIDLANEELLVEDLPVVDDTLGQ